jgi:hypothetical protein
MPIIPVGVVSSSSREPSAAPTLVSVTDVGINRLFNDGAAVVTFTAPTVDGGLPVINYTVTATHSGGSSSASATSSPYTMTGLLSNTSYTFTVIANNGAAPSAPSNSITRSITTVPDNPTSVTAVDVGTSRAYDNGAATITFTPPTNNGGALITSYSAISGTKSGTNTASPISVTTLLSNTPYTFTVRAINSNGSSSGTNANSITATTIPQAPTIGTAVAGNTQATVPFTINNTGGKPIIDFTALSNPGSKTNTNTASPITVTTLTNGTPYTFTVTGRNLNGSSAASAASNSVTPAAPPPPPPPPPPDPGPPPGGGGPPPPGGGGPPPPSGGVTCGACQEYTVIQPTCNGEDVYQGIYVGTRKSCSDGTFQICSSPSFTGFGSCISSNNRGCGGSGPDGPC